MSAYIQGTASLQPIADRYGALPKQVDRAIARAIRTTCRWATREGRTGIAKALHVSIGVLRGRVQVYINLGKSGVGRGWFGTNDLNSSRLNPIQTSAGASAAGLGEVPHAFVQTVHGTRMIFRRQTKLRYPLEAVKLPIHQQAEETLFADVFPKIEEQLRKNFEAELGKEVLK
jgi:hypothetical protein